MADYIERGFALDVVKRTSGDYAAAFAEIAHAPAAAVAPVVRCRECKHWKPGDFMAGDDIDHMYRGGGCPIRRFAVYENDFCSEGERRESNENQT